MIDRQFAAVLGCFALSGFAALLYQTAWLREFAFVFGTAELAVVSVLAAYMAGLALGAAIAARITDRIRRPVLVYGVLELAIALCALGVPWAIRASTRLYVHVMGSSPLPPEEGGIESTLFFAACSFAILSVPTALMGVTLPLLARHAIRREEQIGSRIGVLYAVNTAGAVAGTLSAAFLLLPALGLRSTVYVGAAANGLVFAVAVLVARAAPILPAAGTSAAGRTAADGGTATASEDRSVARSGTWILPLIAASGVTSFTYEVMWTRLLGHVLGGSVYAFATMLASFLVGIAVGSGVAARLATTRLRAARGFCVAQCGAAFLSLGAYAALDWLPAMARSIGASAHGSLGANAVVAAAFLLPAALCFGATFPFAVRLLARDEADAAAASARVYAWNTTGSIAGALLAGLVLLPVAGFSGTLMLAVATNWALALITAQLVRPALRVATGVAALGLGALIALPPSPPWRIVRAGPTTYAPSLGDVVHFGVGRSATVLLVDKGANWRLTTNGLNEAVIDRPGARPGQAITTRWLAVLPVLARPSARSLALVGLGGGLTLQAVPSSVESIDVIELEPEVVAANRAVAQDRDSDPLADPRVRIHVNDARGALLLTRARYDVIVSQPSHPWTAGASHLYTREFFELVRERLTPDGVFSQWIGMRFVDEPLLKSLVATLLDVFPNVRVYQPTPVSLVFLASPAPLALEDRAEAVLASAPDDYAQYGLSTVEDLAAGLVLDEAGSRAFAAGAAVNTDHRNRLAARSPRLGSKSLGVGLRQSVFAPFDNLPERSAALDRGYVFRRLQVAGRPARATVFAEALTDPAERVAASAWVDMQSQRPIMAARRFRQALSVDPSSIEARAGLLWLARRQLEAGEGDPLLEELGPLDAASTAVVAGWIAQAAGDWSALEALDGQLAQAGPRHPLLTEATRLRAAWRMQSGEPARAAEAVGILDAITILNPQFPDLVLRIRLQTLAQQPLAALATIEETLQRVRRPEQARTLLAAVDALPVDVRPQVVASARARLEALLR